VTVLERWHVGPWTTSGTAVGAPLEPGRRRTPDELNFDVVGLARILGRRLDGRAELQVRLWQNELRPTHTRLVGVHTLADPANSELLRQTAAEAFTWLSSLAPDGYEFILTDAVRLQPKLDLTAEVVAVDAVIHLAADRGDTYPADRLAASHVRQSPTGDWYAGNAICNWSGPYATADEALATIRAARGELADQLRAGGHNDLADTEPRWAPVPIEQSPVT
jgi:hypothetical protein